MVAFYNSISNTKLTFKVSKIIVMNKDLRVFVIEYYAQSTFVSDKVGLLMLLEWIGKLQCTRGDS